MLAAPAEAPFDAPDHLFEPKLDGFRCLAFCDDGDVTLYSRTGRVVTSVYPEVVNVLRRLPGEMVLDGELVVVDGDGVPRFQLMQQRNHPHGAPVVSQDKYPVHFVPFDLCWLDGDDLRDRPLEERRNLLSTVPDLAAVPAVVGAGCDLYAQALQRGLEGVVAKRLDSPYRSGARSRAWRKIKAVHESTVVVAGFTRGTGGRAATFGALVMAQAGEEGWLHVGDVGTGFDDPTLKALRGAFDQIVVPHSPLRAPFLVPPGVTWVEPCVVIKVEHRGWTLDHRLRAPSYKGVVAGTDPESVRHELEVAPP